MLYGLIKPQTNMLVMSSVLIVHMENVDRTTVQTPEWCYRRDQTYPLGLELVRIGFQKQTDNETWCQTYMPELINL